MPKMLEEKGEKQREEEASITKERERITTGISRYSYQPMTQWKLVQEKKHEHLQRIQTK